MMAPEFTVTGFSFACPILSYWASTSKLDKDAGAPAYVSNPTKDCATDSTACRLFQVDVSSDGTKEFFLWVKAGNNKFQYMSEPIKIIVSAPAVGETESCVFFREEAGRCSRLPDFSIDPALSIAFSATTVKARNHVKCKNECATQTTCNAAFLSPDGTCNSWTDGTGV